MSEDTYEYECMRAELLGVEKPTLDDYLSRQKEKQAADVELEEILTENLKEKENEKEDIQNVSKGLHELSTILSATQKKLNRFKASCGSLTNLLKIKMGNAGSSESIVQDSQGGAVASAGVDNTIVEPASPKIDPIEKLDLMIERAENCHISMSKQNQQMKKFLR